MIEEPRDSGLEAGIARVGAQGLPVASKEGPQGRHEPREQNGRRGGMLERREPRDGVKHGVAEKLLDDLGEVVARMVAGHEGRGLVGIRVAHEQRVAVEAEVAHEGLDVAVIEVAQLVVRIPGGPLPVLRAVGRQRPTPVDVERRRADARGAEPGLDGVAPGAGRGHGDGGQHGIELRMHRDGLDGHVRHRRLQ
ncbi:hypothetical protein CAUPRSCDRAFT_12055 [Caulochytrium protostelioides]|uniref:Uncharacterized protein n=1 Tax=Caulochytrium protostelioides TaxID=1555241 RepID=A0A4P9WSM1_9FUNG|nr:hypothetical protein CAUPRSCDRAFT_12055 [Caulochytrium protostelioides]